MISADFTDLSIKSTPFADPIVVLPPAFRLPEQGGLRCEFQNSKFLPSWGDLCEKVYDETVTPSVCVVDLELVPGDSARPTAITKRRMYRARPDG